MRTSQGDRYRAKIGLVAVGRRMYREAEAEERAEDDGQGRGPGEGEVLFNEGQSCEVY